MGNVKLFGRVFDKREKLLWLCWLTYSIAYTGRSGFNANISAIIDTYGITKATAGLVGTYFFIAYACGQFLHGSLCRYYPKKTIVPLVMIISGLTNLSFVFQLPFAVYKYFWLINGISLSVLMPTIVQILSVNSEGSDPKHDLVMISLTSFGVLLSFGISSLFNLIASYRLVFFVVSVLCFFTAAIWFFSYPKLAKDEGFTLRDIPLRKEKRERASSALAGQTLTVLSVLCFASVTHKLILDGFNTWAPKILKDQYGMSDSLSIALSLFLPLCGTMGAIVLLWFSKRIHGDFSLSGTIFLIVSVFSGFLILFSDSSGWLRESPIPFFFSFCVIYCLTSSINAFVTAELPLRMKENAGKITGIFNGCCYLGSSISSYLLGYVADRSGWIGVFWLLFWIGVASTALLFGAQLFVSLKKKKSKN